MLPSALGDVLGAVPDPLATSTTAVFAIAAVAGVIAAIVGRRRVAARHLVFVAALTASIMVAIVSIAGVRTTVVVPWWQSVATTRSSEVTVRRATEGPGREPRHGARRTLFWLWIVGATWIAFRSGIQARAVGAMRRRATPVSGPAWADAIRRARSNAKPDRAFEVLQSPEIDVPFVTGLVRPAVIVPSAAIEWTAEERESVLAHEIAHLTRLDLWARAAATVACSLHWFNPVTWWLAWQADRDAEVAADDVALRSGILPSAYASALLSLAEQVSWRRPAPAGIAFLRRSSLEPRIRAVLAPSERQPVLGNRARLTIITVACSVASVAGCVTLVPVTLIVPDVSRSPVAISQPSGPTGDWVDAAAKGLVETLGDPSPQVRMAAANALRRFDDPAARAAVDRALDASRLTRASLERMQEDKK